MKQYFIFENNLQAGPFSIDELRQKDISKNTPVWTEGMPDWAKISDVKELKAVLQTAPPVLNSKPFVQAPVFMQPTQNSARKAGFGMGKPFTLVGISVAALVLFAFLFFRKKEVLPIVPAPVEASTTTTIVKPLIAATTVVAPTKADNAKEIKAATVKREKQNPGNYLLANTTMRKNLIGEKVFEGTITNKATAAIYKDIVVEIEFLSKTDGVIGNKRFTVYEIVPPRQRVKFKFKTSAPSNSKGFKAGVVEAGSIE